MTDIETIAGRELVAGKKWRGLCLEYEADVSALDAAEVLDVGDAALAETHKVIRELGRMLRSIEVDCLLSAEDKDKVTQYFADIRARSQDE